MSNKLQESDINSLDHLPLAAGYDPIIDNSSQERQATIDGTSTKGAVSTSKAVTSARPRSGTILGMSTAGIIAPKKLDDHLLDIAHAHPGGSIGGTLMSTMINRRRKLQDRFQSVTNAAKSGGAASENPKGAESAKPAASEAPAKEKPAEASGKKDESKKEEKADAKK